MHFIGDIHGKYDEYFSIIKNLKKSIQLGDFGLGFKPTLESWDKQHQFIRGNHDSPKECKKHPNYLGDYGYKNGVFYISGAYSIDYKYRWHYEAVNNKKVWWEDEQLSEKTMEKVLALYKKTKPKIVISHDCPSEIRKKLPGMNAKNKHKFKNRTSDGLLSTLFMIHKPKVWVFGHYHCSFDKVVKNTRFICLDELETIEVEE